MTTNELETLRKVREEYYAGNQDLNARVLAGEILPWAKSRVESGNYDVNIHVLNSAIESLERAEAKAAKSAPKKCPKCGTPMTASGKCDECDDWDN